MDKTTLIQCQNCRAQIQIAHIGGPPQTSEPSPGLPSRLEESFMLLEDAWSGRQPVGGGNASLVHPDTLRMEESFVVLNEQQAASNLIRRPTARVTSSFQSQQRFSLDDRMQALARVLDIASSEAAIDFPLCADCFKEVERELEQQAEELESQAAAYTALEQRLREELESGTLSPMDDRTYQRELKRAQDEVKHEEANLARAEAALLAAENRIARAEAAHARLKTVEIQYWHAFNAVMMSLRATADFRDSLQQRVDATKRSLTTLKQTKILHDIFHIWHDGPYGTISGLRLGSTPAIPVEWHEINAAWGQAVLLLDCIARALGVGFSQHRLEPRGSYPRIHDSRGAAELYGPANKIVCLSYDRAQVAFLACLKELAKGLAAKGATDENEPFALKYPIEGDRVGGISIRYGMSRDKAWTKALKYMLVNLKFCLKVATVLLDNRRALASSVMKNTMAALPREGPNNASSSVAGASRLVL